MPSPLALTQPPHTEAELLARWRLFDLDAADLARLRHLHQQLRERVDGVVERFLQTLRDHPESQGYLADASTLAHLPGLLRQHILELFEGRLDLQLVANRARVGQALARRGVPLRLYLAALRLLYGLLQEELTLFGASRDWLPPEVADHLGSLTKVILFDSHLVCDAYLQAATVPEPPQPEPQPEFPLEPVHKDPLTGLYNRDSLYDLLRHHLSGAARHREILTLAYIDLNGFRSFNELEGSQTGDQLLVAVAAALHDSVRVEDLPGRLGEDDFCIIMPKTAEAQAVTVCQRLFRAFNERSQQTRVTLSVGLAQTDPEVNQTIDELIRLAASRMAEARAEAVKRPGHYIRRGVQGL